MSFGIAVMTQSGVKDLSNLRTVKRHVTQDYTVEVGDWGWRDVACPPGVTQHNSMLTIEDVDWGNYEPSPTTIWTTPLVSWANATTLRIFNWNDYEYMSKHIRLHWKVLF